MNKDENEPLGVVCVDRDMKDSRLQIRPKRHGICWCDVYFILAYQPGELWILIDHMKKGKNQVNKNLKSRSESFIVTLILQESQDTLPRIHLVIEVNKKNITLQ